MEDNKIVDIADVKNENATEENNTEPQVAIKDPTNPLDGLSVKNIEQMIKNLQSMVQVMEEQWRASEREFKLTNTNMQELYKWNEEHKTPMPEGLSEEEKEKWDILNGIDCITDEEIHRIFGEEHLIYGVDHSQTVDRIKGATEDFMHWILAMQEYRQVHDAYIQLLEMEEEKNIQILKTTADKEEDPEKKAKLLAAVDEYYSNKYLGFIAEPLEERFINRTINALSDSRKVEYWIKRTRDKLKQIKVSSKFILEISQFEKRILEEKYWENSNILLLYFMQLIIDADLGNTKNKDRLKVVCMISALDSLIRGTVSEENKSKLLDNIRALEDQFLGLCPKQEESNDITPPTNVQ